MIYECNATDRRSVRRRTPGPARGRRRSKSRQCCSRRCATASLHPRASPCRTVRISELSDFLSKKRAQHAELSMQQSTPLVLDSRNVAARRAVVAAAAGGVRVAWVIQGLVGAVLAAPGVRLATVPVWAACALRWQRLRTIRESTERQGDCTHAGSRWGCRRSTRTSPRCRRRSARSSSSRRPSPPERLGTQPAPCPDPQDCRWNLEKIPAMMVRPKLT